MEVPNPALQAEAAKSLLREFDSNPGTTPEEVNRSLDILRKIQTTGATELPAVQIYFQGLREDPDFNIQFANIKKGLLIRIDAGAGLLESGTATQGDNTNLRADLGAIALLGLDQLPEVQEFIKDIKVPDQQIPEQTPDQKFAQLLQALLDLPPPGGATEVSPAASEEPTTSGFDPALYQKWEDLSWDDAKPAPEPPAANSAINVELPAPISPVPNLGDEREAESAAVVDLGKSIDVVPPAPTEAQKPKQELPPESYKVPMPTELLDQLKTLVSEDRYKLLASGVNRLISNFTPYNWRNLREEILYGYTFRSSDDEVEFMTVFDQILDPADYKLAYERDLAQQLNPEAFEKMGLVVDDFRQIGYQNPTIKFGDAEFKIVSGLGGGLYAEDVYLATSPNGEKVVIKKGKFNLNKVNKNQFLEEPYSLIQLEAYQRQNNLLVDGEPLTPKFLASGRANRSTEYFVMSAAQGTSLAEIIRFGWLPTIDIATIGEQAARVYEALHALGKADHDFQVKNIFWEVENRRINIIDWNMLSPCFRFDGEAILPAEPAEDLYRLNMALLKASRVKFDYDEAKKIKDPEQVLAAADIDPRLKAIFAKALNVDPAQRYQTAHDLRMAFVQLLEPIL